MRRSFVLLLALGALAAAAVMPLHRHRRALPDDTEGSMKPFCAPETPCAWNIYQPETKKNILNLTNDFCSCSPATKCIWTNDDPQATAFVFKCRTEAEAKLIHRNEDDDS